jgi:hypothetical protein
MHAIAIVAKVHIASICSVAWFQKNKLGLVGSAEEGVTALQNVRKFSISDSVTSHTTCFLQQHSC